MRLIDADKAIEVLEEVKRYRQIGTVEEFREAREKQVPKKVDYEGDGYDDAGNIIYDTAICPTCNKRFEVDYDDCVNYCPDCGQRLKWEE